MNRRFPTLLLASISLSVSPAVRAAPAPEPTQEEEIQQMQDMRQQVMQNMIDKGIDPQQFMMQVRDQFMNGTFDPAEFQQRLVDQGLIDNKMLERMQGTAQRFMVSGIREQLAVTDDEWAVLAPKIRKVVELGLAAGETAAGGGGGRGGAALMMGAAPASGPVAKAMAELRAILKDRSATPERIVEKLTALREAKEKAKADLEAAKQDLESVLTKRQEAVLLNLGYL